MSWWFVASVSCALVAGAGLPRSPDRGLDRLAASGSRRRVAVGAAGQVGRQRWQAQRVVPGVPVRPWHERAKGLLVRARDAERNRTRLIELADALSAELRAGAPPREALWRAAGDQPSFAGVAAVARSPAGDVVSALRELAILDGGAAAADLATAWLVCETTGGRLAAPVARLAGAWRDDEQVRREVTAALAGPRATAVLLAGLPLAGIAMGAALGADPVALLRQPSVALVVLVPGLLLELAGLLWTAGITRRAATW
jgi:tight adherence protein B